MIKDGNQVVCLLPSKSDPLAARIATAAEVKGEQVNTERKDLLCHGVALMLIASISVHIN